MTLYQIEVRANAEQHDVHAHQLAHEIGQLPTRHLSSLAEISAGGSQPKLRTAQLYRLSGQLSATQLAQLTEQLLVDAVVQEAHITPSEQTPQNTPTGHIVDVFFHAGVTDTLAESVLAGAAMLNISGLEHVETGRRFILDERLSEPDLHTIAQALLYNGVIQHYTVQTVQDQQQGRTPELKSVTATEQAEQSIVRTIPLSQMTDEQLLAVSKEGLLSLNLAEMQAIQQHYQSQGREPTDVELETLAQTWSEHCSHKTFKATVNYRELDAQGNEVESETIRGLLKSYIMRATNEVNPDWLVSAFSDNAGIIRLTETQDIAFKVETHNHPSAIEPFGGANTGVGGVIRDVVGVSAEPIACTDVLCFGPQDVSSEALPAGILTPRRIASGVVSGVRDYGNKMGIPTVNGAVLYDPGYIYNPLVFCGCLGILPHGSHPNNVQPGDLIVSLGGRTGRDGVHGATFSSGEMSLEINTQAGTAVQIGAPITEKKVTDVILQARDRQLYSAITDCGAGGFSSAIGEMGAKTGAKVELSHAPLKYQGLAPWEIWLSEAQERMIIAVPPTKIDELLAICAIEEVEATILGTFTGDHRLTLTYHDQVVADMDMEFLHDGLPSRTLDAVWKRPHLEEEMRRAQSITEDTHVAALLSSLNPTLISLLRHPNIASKEEIVRRYDHEVRGATVGKPLVGRSKNGPGDAAVLQPLIGEDAKAGVVLSNGVNPLYGKYDAYHMTVNAVDEALRNLTAVGGDVARTAILDNFCWGNPTDPEQLGTLVRAVKGCYDAGVGFGVPFISGKDSLNNEYRANGQRLPVIPTILISAVSVIDDVTPTIDMSLKAPGNMLFLIGKTRNELSGSHYAEVIDPASFSQHFPYTEVPQVEIPRAYNTMKALGEAIRSGLVRSCHDLSEGGLAVAAAEMALAGHLGVTLSLEHITVKSAVNLQHSAETITRLFSESPSRFIVEIAPEQWGSFERFMRDRQVADITYIGKVTQSSRFIANHGEDELINLSVNELQDAWKGGQA
ncbi:phosphoribosylformylglycinamidine synthase subunit PurL [Tengunoibacter tsumagoiensis]|uniref:Phosphoribosylformylglycinamidine synthase subunit PurL n=1 Tax=Tengunoibacter tsumagoiensis TaxID=2014871 RepID=A0A401ZUX5_9CHLR|nr:phosphoribosylformylglycinamidine synthase subunit PurL [Tengunoibacter tsumagoiensis]GCE10748.1 phosphoribosylformylglycinamidine synthase subunit PurL [Tengunoibacter tsumagoiensis]